MGQSHEPTLASFNPAECRTQLGRRRFEQERSDRGCTSLGGLSQGAGRCRGTAVGQGGPPVRIFPPKFSAASSRDVQRRSATFGGVQPASGRRTRRVSFCLSASYTSCCSVPSDGRDALSDRVAWRQASRRLYPSVLAPKPVVRGGSEWRGFLSTPAQPKAALVGKEAAREREREASCSLQFGVSIYRRPFKHLKGRCQKHGRG